MFIVLLLAVLAVTIRPTSEAVAGNSWVAKAPMPTPRGGLGAAAVDGKIYAIGGSTELLHNKSAAVLWE